MPGRLIGKQYPNTTTVTYTYETTTSRLKSVTDAASQVKTYSYARDDRLLGIAYTGAVNPTPDVGFTWDPYFPRLASRPDGAGTTQFTYVPVGSLGALQVQQEAGPFADSAITSAYDELGRLSQRTVQGTGAETFQHDAIGRLTGHGSDLGAFTLGYLRQTGQITSRQLASSTLATTWSYLTNTNDRRLSGINNVGLTSGHFSTFAYTDQPRELHRRHHRDQRRQRGLSAGRQPDGDLRLRNIAPNSDSTEVIKILYVRRGVRLLLPPFGAQKVATI